MGATRSWQGVDGMRKGGEAAERRGWDRGGASEVARAERHTKQWGCRDSLESGVYARANEVDSTHASAVSGTAGAGRLTVERPAARPRLWYGAARAGFAVWPAARDANRRRAVTGERVDIYNSACERKR